MNIKNSNKHLNNFDDNYYISSHWQLVWRKFRKHKLAIFGGSILIFFYIIAIFADFFAINNGLDFSDKYIFVSPKSFYIKDANNSFTSPYIYKLKQTIDPITWRKKHEIVKNKIYKLRFFTDGYEYKLFGLIRTNKHFIGVDNPGKWYPFGTDELGRCLFSRVILASKISLFIGLIGVLLSFTLGCIFGGISGYFGGTVDLIIQRITEFVISIPAIPLWMALAAALPSNWSSVEVFFGITIVLSAIGWANLARVVRGKIFELRESDFIMAARIAGMPSLQIIIKHLLPSFLSYLIVSLTLGIPGMILGESALSFLQIGIRPPAVSWGVLLQSAQNIRSLSESPWLLIPGIFIITTVLCFNFVGDGLRDAADPYK